MIHTTKRSMFKAYTVNLLMTIIENSCLFQFSDAYDVVVTAGTFMPNHIESAAVKETVRVIRPGL